jgi:hypothetical protein
MLRVNKIGFFLIMNWFVLSGLAVNFSLRGKDRTSIYDIRQNTSENLSKLRLDSMKLSIIAPSSGVQFYKDGIVFLSRTRDEVRMSQEHVSFGTIEAFYARLSDTVLGKHIIFNKLNAFQFPCDGITFSSDYNSMYYTRIPGEDYKEKIFFAKSVSDGRKDSIWVSDSKPLSFCTGNYIYTHPSLSFDGNILIFASDMPGSLGGMDLYFVRKEGDNWSLPVNMGTLINSPGNEMFPFLDPDNNLYYSSDGLYGKGGYDIFSCKFNGKSWGNPVNLGPPINTENDEVGFSIEKKYNRTAVYSRRQISNKNKMQLIIVGIKGEIPGNSQLTISNILNGKS